MTDTPDPDGTRMGVEAIKARLEAATEGPWIADGLEGNLTSPSGDVLHVQMWQEADAEFIAHARTDVPALLDEVDRLRVQHDECHHAFDRVKARLDEVEAENERLQTIVLQGAAGSVCPDLRTHGERVHRIVAAAESAAARFQAANREHIDRVDELETEVTRLEQRIEASNDAETDLIVAQVAVEDLQAVVARVRKLIPAECWVLSVPATGPVCTDMIGGGFPNGAKWTEEMCCVPCRLRAALAVPTTTEGSDG